MCIFPNIIVRKSVKGEEWGEREGGKKEKNEKGEGRR